MNPRIPQVTWKIVERGSKAKMPSAFVELTEYSRRREYSKRKATCATSMARNSTPETSRSVSPEGGVEVAAVKDRDFYSKPEASERDPLCTSVSEERVTRGGSIYSNEVGCHSAFRRGAAPSTRASGPRRRGHETDSGTQTHCYSSRFLCCLGPSTSRYFCLDRKVRPQ